MIGRRMITRLATVGTMTAATTRNVSIQLARFIRTKPAIPALEETAWLREFMTPKPLAAWFIQSALFSNRDNDRLFSPERRSSIDEATWMRRDRSRLTALCGAHRCVEVHARRTAATAKRQPKPSSRRERFQEAFPERVQGPGVGNPGRRSRQSRGGCLGCLRPLANEPDNQEGWIRLCRSLL